MTLGSFEDYVDSLSQLSDAVDPTIPTAESVEIRRIAAHIGDIETVDRASLVALISDDPEAIPVLGMAVGLTREKLKNVLRHNLGSPGWNRLARLQAGPLIDMLDEQYNLIELVDQQRHRDYDFGDILVARSGTRRTATDAGLRGRRVEDEIEQVAVSLGLSCSTRTRFVGRNDQTAPCDLAIPEGGTGAVIVVAAKGFDSTGSKLTEAVRELEEMADKRKPSQYVMAAIDGIGWKGRMADLRRIYELRATNQIDGLYTLQGLSLFRDDLESAARRHGLI
jgi:hypothetical protein